MIKAKIGFVKYGTHKDGLRDPSGDLFINDEIIERSIKALRDKGHEVVVNDLVVAKKHEAKQIICDMATDRSIDCLVLFPGCWIWASEMIGALREYAKTGRGIVIWTYPGSQGWRAVGGLVLKAALKEVGIKHRFVFGRAEDEEDLARIISYCQASAVKNRINLKTMANFGGRGMGQTCGVADASQWMKMFGIDIDTRDTTELVKVAEASTAEEISEVYKIIEEKFVEMPERNDITDRSIRLYIALKKICKENDYSFYTIQSFPGLADNYTATCFAQSMMLEDGVPTSTLSDFNTALTSILIMYLSEERPYYGDFQHIIKSKNEIRIVGDGAIPPSLADERGATFAKHGVPTEGSADGLSVSLVCKAGEGVVARFSRVDGKFVLVITRCTVSVPADDERQALLQESGLPYWPHAFVTVHCDIDELLEEWDNEYACLGFGEHLYQQMIDFAELTDIEVIKL